MSPAGSHTPATSPDKPPENRCESLPGSGARVRRDAAGDGRMTAGGRTSKSLGRGHADTPRPDCHETRRVHMTESSAADAPVQSPLTLVMTVKPEDREILRTKVHELQAMPPEKNPVTAALGQIGTVHFAR